MKHLSGIDVGAQGLHVSTAGRAAASDESRPRPAESADQGAPAPAAAPVTREEAEAAVARLQEALDQADGPAREVDLTFGEEGEYLVEIKRCSDGQVVQRFPPENLLNPKGKAADLLGTVVDRLS